MIGWVYVAALTLLTALSLRTIAVLRAAAPWTAAGWWATIGYDTLETIEIVRHAHLPFALPYWVLAALVGAFIVAGVRDEPQGEPWWWPVRRGPTRRARRSG